MPAGWGKLEDAVISIELLQRKVYDIVEGSAFVSKLNYINGPVATLCLTVDSRISYDLGRLGVNPPCSLTL